VSSSLPPSPSRLQYFFALVWLALTVSLASWWMVVGLRLATPGSLDAIDLLGGDFRRMFLWEGATFIGLLVAGGAAILLAIRREQQRRRVLETFFMSFTHDLKTSLSSVQLQAEGLREDWPQQAGSDQLDRLLHDMVRLQIQLENSLFVAQPDGRLLRERIEAAQAIHRLAQDWPLLEIRVAGNAALLADARGFDAVMRNLFQNAVVHGGARAVDVAIAPQASGIVRLTIVDDGRGVSSTVIDELGQPFVRPDETSGTGVGLFVCSQLVQRMHGALRFGRGAQPVHGLTVELDLPGAR
jgi:signal transduction histidine kinase